LRIDTSSQVTIGKNTFTNGYKALLLYDCDYITVSGNVMKGGAGNGIELQLCGYCTIATNTVTAYAQGSGIVVYTSCVGNTVTGNATTGCVNGILVGGVPAPVADRTVVVGNRSTANSLNNFANAGTNTTNSGNDFV
jgi:parallel beta-helix repeat protein